MVLTNSYGFWGRQSARIDADGAWHVFVAFCGHTHVADQLEHGGHVLQTRHVFQGDGISRQQGRTQLWQRRVFSARDSDRAVQRLAALDE